MDENNMYHTPSTLPPTMSTMQNVAQELGFDLSDEDLQDYQDTLNKWCESCDEVDRLIEPALPVKYPRFPGHRPTAEENRYNAWAWKSEIQGAPSGKLHGKTIAIKDNIGVAGVPMRNGSNLMEGYIPEFDATVVTRILDEGGKILGKSSCEDLCISGSSFTCATGPVQNPHNPSYSAGGSSSGSAVLVQTGEVDMALGADQGGSVRIPACWTGVVGIKPTYGLVPYTGACSMDTSVDFIGPIARTVKDCALLLEIIAGYDDGLDPGQCPHIEVKEYSKNLTENLSGVKVGLLTEAFSMQGSEPDVVSMVTEAAYSLRKVGAEVGEVSVPLHKKAGHIGVAKLRYSIYENLANSHGPGPGSNGFYPTSLMEQLHRAVKVHPNNLSHFSKSCLLFGKYIHGRYGMKFYNKATNLCRPLAEAYNNALKEFDVLVMPTIPKKATKLPRKGSSCGELLNISSTVNVNTIPFNLTGHPAISVNTGFSNGLPVGMMIVGKHWEDQTVLNVAHVYETLCYNK